MVMPYHLHMPSYFLETFTEYPYHSIMHITGYKFLDSLLSLLKITPRLYKASPHIAQLMVQIKPQHIKNTILHIAETPVPLSDSEFLNAFLP